MRVTITRETRSGGEINLIDAATMAVVDLEYKDLTEAKTSLQLLGFDPLDLVMIAENEARCIVPWYKAKVMYGTLVWEQN